MRVALGALLIVFGILCDIPGFELIYEAWNLPTYAASPVSMAGVTLGHRQACAIFLVPATILAALGVAVAMSYRPSE